MIIENQTISTAPETQQDEGAIMAEESQKTDTYTTPAMRMYYGNKIWK